MVEPLGGEVEGVRGGGKEWRIHQCGKWQSRHHRVNFKYQVDRITVSLARRLGVPLVTCDSQILTYGHVMTMW